MILDYLRKNPDPSDTLEGISRWWLKLEKTDIAVDEVSKALDSLIKEGLIKKQTIPGNITIYKVCKG